MTDKKFSLSDLTPSIGDLSRSPVGTVAYYEVEDFKVAGTMQTYANSIGGKLTTTSMYCFDAKTPQQLNKLVQVVVKSSARRK